MKKENKILYNEYTKLYKRILIYKKGLLNVCCEDIKNRNCTAILTFFKKPKKPLQNSDSWSDWIDPKNQTIGKMN